MLHIFKTGLSKTLATFTKDTSKESLEFEFVSCNGSADKRKTLNIYVHGYSAIMTPLDKYKMKSKIGVKCVSNYRNFLFTWASGSVAKHLATPQKLQTLGMLLSASTGFKDRILLGAKSTMDLFDHFKGHQTKCEVLGEHILLQEIKKFFKLEDFSETKINLIGHSLGCRMILTALQKNKELAQKMKIENVILLAGATSKDIDWWEIVSAINGNVYNFYSDTDLVLIAKPDSEKSIGRYPITDTKAPLHRIKNYQTGIAHWSYWEELEKLLRTTELFGEK
jgi:hypothetical protein